MTHKQYLFSLTALILISLCCVATVSYTVDPGRIYHPPRKLPEFVEKLRASEYGLTRPLNIWNRRDIKSELARNTGRIDCAVIGSSHVMQISSARKNKSLKEACADILNLGVPGAAIEDYLALSYILLDRASLPKVIVFGIDPWSLDFEREHRWVRYKESYQKMRGLLEKKYVYGSGLTSAKEKVINLINPDYFKYSLASRKNMNPDIVELKSFNHLIGTFDDVMLRDGSIVYSEKFINTHTPDKIPVGGTIYKIVDGVQYSDDAIRLFSFLVKFIEGRGVPVVFLLTPYHHNVWKDRKSKTRAALISVEKRLRSLGKELGVNVIGSYDPIRIGCDESEFFDFMHAKDTCLVKIKAEENMHEYKASDYDRVSR